MKLVSNGLHSSMEYNAATLVASKHLGRSVVLSHCTERNSADWKSQLLDSKYNDPYLFGFLPSSSRTIFYNDKSKGSVSLLSGDIPPQVSAKEVKINSSKGLGFFEIFKKATGCQAAFFQANGPAVVCPFVLQKGGTLPLCPKQGSKASTQLPPKAKNSKREWAIPNDRFWNFRPGL